MTTISAERLTQFIELYEEQFGITLTEAEATELGNNLVSVVSVLQTQKTDDTDGSPRSTIRGEI